MWKAARTRTVTNPSHINLLVTAIQVHARDNCNLLSFASFSQATMVASYLDRLPLEIISMISNALGNDLVGHVTFSTLRPDISGFCYSDKGRDFWQPKLRASGLSLPDDEDEEFDRDDDDWWECLAFKCVEHAETCQHSKCGMARLRENERLMATMPKEVTALDLARALERSRSPHSDSDADDSRSPNLDPVVASTAWSAIAFKRSTRDQWQLITQCETWHEMAFIRADLPAGDKTLAYGDRLENHPLIWRSFATFPPVPFFIVRGEKTVEAGNPRGITVADFLADIVSLDQNCYPVTRDLASSLFSGVERDPGQTPSTDPVLPQTWSFEDGFRAFERFRDWFMLARWTGLDFVPDEDLETVYFTWRFETQTLPKKYRHFKRMVEYSNYSDSDDESE